MTTNPSSTSLCEPPPLVKIPTVLRSRSTAAQNVPVVAGVCVPKGLLTHATSGQIVGSATAVAAQFEVLNRWNDGSVRWMLASFIAPEVSSSGQELSVIASCELSSRKNSVSDSH